MPKKTFPLPLCSYFVASCLFDSFHRLKKDRDDRAEWLDENLSGRWYASWPKKGYRFEKKQDAVLYRLMWGDQDSR